MKILCIGDLHIKLSNIELIRKVKAEILRIIAEKNPDIVVLMGDMQDSFDRIHLQVWNEIIKFISELSEVAKVYYIVGNHDMLNNQVFLTDDHFFNAFKYWNGNPVVVDEREIKPLGDDGGWIGFLPYVPPGRFNEAAELLSDYGKVHGKCRAIFAHQEFYGVSFGPIQSEKGDHWPESYPLVINGHIHEYQWFRKNILYVGSPYQTNFGENEDKSISLITIEADEVKEERIRLNVPKNVLIDINCSDFEALDLNNFDKFKIIISGTTEEILAVKKSKKLKEISDRAKIVYKATDKSMVKRNANNLGFLDLLKAEVDKESVTVQEVFREVVSESQT